MARLDVLVVSPPNDNWVPDFAAVDARLASSQHNWPDGGKRVIPGWMDAAIRPREEPVRQQPSSMHFDAHLPLLIDELLVGERSQAGLADSRWFVHYQTGFDSSDRNVSTLSCLVADNEDHCKPNLVTESREYVARFQPPFTPVRIRVWAPGKRESFVCLVTFEPMHEPSMRTDVHQLVDAPLVDTEEGPPSWLWEWRDMPF